MLGEKKIMLCFLERRATRRLKMIWKNPFQIKRLEHIDSATTFLQLFNCSALKIIDANAFCNVNYFTSSPGAGKTTLFKAFSPEILSYICSQPRRSPLGSDLQLYMESVGAICNKEVKLLSCNLSCARNYELLEEMFENGRRTQVLFALLNCRITIAFIRSIATLAGYKDNGEYTGIKFLEIPDEMASIKDEISDGYHLFKWACREERMLCQYLDGNDTEPLNLEILHTTLLLLKIFEPKNIEVNGQSPYENTLIIFDDFHKLGKRQQEQIISALYTLRPNLGIWIGQRLEGLSNHQIISPDGGLQREYNGWHNLDEYWATNKYQFRAALGDIAKRRVQMAKLPEIEDFQSCLAAEIDERIAQKSIARGIENLKKDLNALPRISDKYAGILKTIDSIDCRSMLSRATYYQCLKIKILRENDRQLSLYLGEVEDWDEFEEFHAKNTNVAEYYFCRNNGLPYYYGLERLRVLSSNNIEQFLYFSAGLFERSRAQALGKKSNNRYTLDANKQDKFIREAAEKKWNDMNYRYVDAKYIQGFLNNISKICISSRDAEKNSYSGGARTGIAIKSDDLAIPPKGNSELKIYEVVMDILGRCVASKYLEKTEVIQSGTRYTVFYLNRWLCVHYDLPLGYGGWKGLSLPQVATMASEEPVEIGEQFSLYDYN